MQVETEAVPAGVFDSTYQGQEICTETPRICGPRPTYQFRAMWLGAAEHPPDRAALSRLAEQEPRVQPHG